MDGKRPSREACVGPARLLILVAVLAACSSNPEPASMSPAASTPSTAAPQPASRADEEALAEAEAEGVDQARLEQAQQDAEEVLDSLDEVNRKEFYLLFGADPLGLSTNPANAARFEIPLETNEAVEKWIEFFSVKAHDRFATYLARAGRYEDMIRTRLREAELPEDLLYLAMIESGMNPNAYSRAHAAGMWQFIRGTGRLYDLEIDYWVDERRDPFKATDAAIAHLGDLYQEFGSWYLAAAAYNAGAGRINRGIQRTGSTDFWDLADARVLRSETRNYVPKLIAAAIIAKNPEKYGFGDVVPLEPLEFDTVEVPDATSFDVLADAAGVSEEDIRTLNPQYPRRVTPPKQAAEVRVPAGTAERFVVAYAEVPPSERVTWLEHRVQRGETLGHIAGLYGTSVTAIRAANNNVNPRRLQIGQRLVIPRSGASPTRVASAAPSGGASASGTGPLTVTVQRGDTLWAISRRYNVSTAQLMQINGLDSSRIHPGDRITVRR
ncbi:MAG: LysM peptidoglycan-binding domain-containing protein [Candidatus Palauibacterales bacterium]|nr:LysM peptidoglycan-binding domain-containing protein [Candidatus Palauibacterales bacterium]